MQSIKRSAIVPYSAHEMFGLVADIESYSEFLPWCGGARVLSRDEDEIVASLDIHYGSVNKSFTTRNRLQTGKMLEMRLVEGPFNHLQGYWRFTPLGDEGCKVALDMDFSFASKMVEWAVGPIFTRIVDGLVDAFHKRAEQLYGKR